MALLTNILTKFLGNKSERDIREISPILELIKDEYKKIVQLSNDDLRSEAANIRQEILNHIREENETVTGLKTKAESDDIDVLEKEKIYDEIDKIEKIIDKKLEDKLNEVLPIVFAIVKDTARRFKENEYIEVTSNDFDRNLAAKYDHVEIKGDKARYYLKQHFLRRVQILL